MGTLIREVKYRGKRVDTKEWIFGDLTIAMTKSSDFKKAGPYIQVKHSVIGYCYFEVIPESVGQCTDNQDKFGKDIYGPVGIKGGDILYKKEEDKSEPSGYYENIIEVGYKNGAYGWIGETTKAFYSFAEEPMEDYEIKGNKFDNPELLTQ